MTAMRAKSLGFPGELAATGAAFIERFCHPKISVKKGAERGRSEARVCGRSEALRTDKRLHLFTRKKFGDVRASFKERERIEAHTSRSSLLVLRDSDGRVYILSINAWPNSLHLSRVAPSISRSKS